MGFWLLKLTNRTNSERLKIALGLPDLFTFLAQRLIKLKVNMNMYLKKN